MIYAEILAAGKGTRLGNTELPKQYLMLGTKPTIIHVIEQFIINKDIDKVLVCCHRDWLSYMDDLLKKYLPNSKVIVIEGGETRNETIMAGCNYISKNFGINDDDYILTHDAARPFVNQKIINDNIMLLKKYDAVNTVIPASDTIVESHIDGKITDIPNRKNMYLGQTPQSFKIQKLMDYYNKISKDDKDSLTDACKIFLLNNDEVGYVLGDIANIKITELQDLKIANAILSERGQK